MAKTKLKHQIKELIESNDFLEKLFIENDNLNFEIYYYRGISNIDFFNDHYFKKINSENYQVLNEEFPGLIKIFEDINPKAIAYQLSKGNIIFSVNESCNYFVELSKLSDIKQQPSHIDPTNMFETKNDFTDSAIDNVALITKRLKNEELVIRHYILGNKSKTDCYLIFLKSIQKQEYVENILTAIENANDDYYISINDLNTLFIKDELVPKTFFTSSPNTICSNIINGKVSVILDNTPIAISLPTTLSIFSSVKNEINTPKYYSLFNKLFIILFLILSVFSLGFFISIINYHTSFLSPIFIANIQLTERGTSFPIFFEILIILFLYDFYRYATSRSPQNYIQSIVIFFGSLVVGQNAIQSGTIGSLIMMITSLSYLSSFAVTTNPYLISSMNFARLTILVFSYFLGLIGFVFSSFLVIIYLGSLTSFGTSFLAPFSPVNFKNILNFFIPTRGKERNTL